MISMELKQSQEELELFKKSHPDFTSDALLIQQHAALQARVSEQLQLAAGDALVSHR
jgi:hypothetical protein